MSRGAITKKSISTIRGESVKVVRKNASVGLLQKDDVITNMEAETDKRARGATKAAISKAKACKKPVARYDVEKQMAYLEYADGNRTYIK